MPHPSAALRPEGLRAERGPRRLAAWWAALVALVALVCAAPARAQGGVEVVELAAVRGAEAVALEYQLRVTLPRAAEEAAQRGVPLYFKAQATLWRSRWYWRDERVARAAREWRLSWQPLTSSWRVSQGGFGQSFGSLPEALGAMSRSAGWRIAEAAQIEADSRYYLEFDWALDTAQLPRPLQIGLTGLGGGAGDWALGVERVVRLAAAEAR